jgi:hypothetical protein
MPIEAPDVARGIDQRQGLIGFVAVNAVVGRAVTGMKIKGMPTFRTRARVWFDELATGPRESTAESVSR